MRGKVYLNIIQGLYKLHHKLIVALTNSTFDSVCTTNTRATLLRPQTRFSRRSCVCNNQNLLCICKTSEKRMRILGNGAKVKFKDGGGENASRLFVERIMSSSKSNITERFFF